MLCAFLQSLLAFRVQGPVYKPTGTNPTRRPTLMTSLTQITSQKPRLQTPSHEELGLQQINFEGTQFNPQE